MLGKNETKVLTKIVEKTKIDRIRSQQIRESCGIQLLMSGRKEEEEEEERMGRPCNKNFYAERFVKFTRDNIPAGSRSPERPKRKWSDLIPD